MTSPQEILEGLYGVEDTAPLRATTGGIWHATPIPVLLAAVPALVEAGLLGPSPVLFDAGAGDGRLLATLALTLLEPLLPRLVGLELDASLLHEAEGRFAELRDRLPASRLPRVAEGDFLETSSYSALGLAPAELDLVFNYPDGNERRLLRFLSEHGKPQARLLILSPDREPALGVPPLLRKEVRPPGATAWSLSVYAPASG